MTHDLKEGDCVEITSLKARVERVYPDGAVIFGDNPDDMFTVPSSVIAQAKIAKIEPPLKVGRAMLRRSETAGKIIAIDGDEAWFLPDFGIRSTHHCTALRNIPEDGQ